MYVYVIIEKLVTKKKEANVKWQCKRKQDAQTVNLNKAHPSYMYISNYMPSQFCVCLFYFYIFRFSSYSSPL